jgi:hypothetical protein
MHAELNTLNINLMTYLIKTMWLKDIKDILCSSLSKVFVSHEFVKICTIYTEYVWLKKERSSFVWESAFLIARTFFLKMPVFNDTFWYKYVQF